MSMAGIGALRYAVARGALAATLACAALALGTVHPPRAEAQPLATGLSGIYTYSPTIFKRTHETGARFVRISAYWPGIAPDEKPAQWNPADPADPNYDWEHLDRGLTEAVAAGLTPVLLIDHAPSWAQRCHAPPEGFNDTVCDPDPAALAAFATAAAKRYNGQFEGLPKVLYWQAVNEANLSLFFLPQFNTAGKPLSPDLYRTLNNAFYDAVNAVEPANLVIAGGLGPIAIPKWTIGPMRFTRMLLCMTGTKNPKPTKGNCGGGVRFDIFDIHPYTTGGPTHKGNVNDVQLGDLRKLQTLLTAADRAGRITGELQRIEVWSTEFSWDSKPPDPGGLPMKILSRWTAEALYRSWSAGLSKFFWFSLEDSQRNPHLPYSDTLESGLFYRGATPEESVPKQVFYAFRFPFVAYPRKSGLLFWGRTPTSEPGEVEIQLLKGGKWRKIAVASANAFGIFQGTIDSSYGANRHGKARAVINGDASVPFSMQPVKDFRQPPFGKKGF
jgi:hypothetical protein